MRVYLDASVLVALFHRNSLFPRAENYLRAHRPILIVSDFAAAEFSSAIARLVRVGATTSDEARVIFTDFDVWTARSSQSIALVVADVAAAQTFLRRLDLTLRTPDALNIAIAMRVNATLMTFDEKMAASANILSLAVATA